MLKQTNKIILWISATMGLFTLSISFIISYFGNGMELEFIKPLNKGYKFQITNNALTNQTIKSLRIELDSKFEQDFIFEVTENIKAKITRNGVIIPGGNESTIPATEYKGLDNTEIKAGSKKMFRIPPLISRYYLKPSYAIVKINYSYFSSNFIVDFFDELFSFIGLINKDKTIRYLIIKNDWTEIQPNGKETVMEIMCNEEDMFFRDLCKKYKK
ncbi:MAG: hypothetical protein WBF48_10765 [Halarcobacter sp.]